MNPTFTKLELTTRAQDWIAQFSAVDREVATRLISGLTLVSHSLFDRSIDHLIRLRASEIEGPIALYAVRELADRDELFSFEAKPSQSHRRANRNTINALGTGADVGSEARVAAALRNIARSDSAKFLNHPTIGAMRKARCRAIFVVDDIIGSGNRTRRFIDALWASKSLRSWWSLKKIAIFALAYTASSNGIRHVSRSHCRPTCSIERGCPTFYNLPWKKTLINQIVSVCNRYGLVTSKPQFALGYGNTMAALVFEHGAPNNTPAILWAPETHGANWRPLFPSRTVLPEEKSAFPSALVRRDPISILLDVGQNRLAQAVSARPGEIDETTLTVLAFAQKGVRSTEALSFATGLSKQECAIVMGQCITWNLLTPTLRLTPSGLSELQRARRLGRIKPDIAPRGEEDYYPKSLRRTV